MPNRAKPSDWQPVGIEALDVTGLYSDEIWQSIFTLVEIENGEQQEKLRNRILKVAGYLNADIHYQKRPKPKEVQAALERIQKLAEQLSEAISETDKDTINLLKQVAGKEPHNPDTEPAPGDMFDFGELRLDRAGEGVDGWLRWSTEAAELNSPQNKQARKPDEAIHRAVAGLRDVWTLTFGTEPTLKTDPKTKKTSGAFLDFIRTSLLPVLEANSLKTTLEHYARKALYG